MASLIIIALVMTAAGVMVGFFIKISSTIRREDRAGTLRWDAPDRTAKSVRFMTGFSRSRWA